ncbi:ABC transporter ATP-binding protein [Chitinophagaceae bacterium MMS25-I14]
MKLSIKNLTKTYANGVKALDDISLEIGNGMFGLLGPNGAGKSSLMRTLATLQLPDSGEILLGEVNALKDPLSIKKVLGYLPQEFGVYPGISAEALLNHFAILKGITSGSERKEVVKYLLDKVNLYNARKRYVAGYSGGMRQRFGIAQALLGNPKLIIVDEPTAGLDPNERIRFNNLLSEISEDIIVILSTHIVDDVSDLCRDMAVMNQGRIVLRGAPSELMSTVKGKVWGRFATRRELPLLQQSHQVLYSYLSEGQPYTRIFADANPGDGFEPVLPKLEDLYFKSIAAGQ